MTERRMAWGVVAAGFVVAAALSPLDRASHDFARNPSFHGGPQAIALALLLAFGSRPAVVAGIARLRAPTDTAGARLPTMPLRSLPRLLCVAALLALAGPAPAASGDPQFAIVNWTSPPQEGNASFDEVPCPVGKHAAGVPVVLFGAKGAPACAGVTREVTQGVITGTCTRVELAPGCDGTGAMVAVIGAGSLDRFRLFPKVPIQDPTRLAEWSRQVSASGLLPAVAARGKRWSCREPIVIAPTPAEAFAFDGLPSSPVFLRLPVTEEGGRASYPLRSATLLVVERGKVTAPFDVHGLEPFAFGIGDAQFLMGGSGCGDCGMRVDEIYAVEKGALRLLVKTSDLST